MVLLVLGPEGRLLFSTTFDSKPCKMLVSSVTTRHNKHFSKLLFVSQKQMEMLQAKQAEETERLREQMEAEAKAQRDQMDNMLKASMKQAEEDRRAFMQENQALNERLVQSRNQMKECSKWWRV